MSVQLPAALNTSQIVFSELKKVGKGGKTSYINYKNEKSGKTERLLIQIPKLFAPFGASTYKKEDQPAGAMLKYNVSLALDTKVKGVTDLVTFLNKLDKMVCKKALKSKDWKKQLDKGMDAEGLKYCYKPIIKASTNEKYPDSLNTKVPIDWNKKQPALQLFSKSREKLDITFDTIETLLPKLSELKGLIQVCSVWFVSKKFGVTIKLLQGMVYPKEGLTGCALIDDDSDDEEEEEDSDEEESDDEDEVEIEDSDDDEE